MGQGAPDPNDHVLISVSDECWIVSLITPEDDRPLEQAKAELELMLKTIMETNPRTRFALALSLMTGEVTARRDRKDA